MALQGTFDTFALADVLRLLGGTAKSGQLHITGVGPEGDVSGDIWLEGGRLVDIDTPEPAGSLAEGLFQMLRVDGGTFSFDPDGRSESDLEAADVGDVIGEAQEMLGEWSDVRRSLPSLEHDLELVSTLATESVTLTAAQWAAIVAVASNRSAHAVADRLKLGALGLGRIVRDLRELGVLHVSMDAADDELDLPPLRLNWSDDSLAGDDGDLSDSAGAKPGATPVPAGAAAPSGTATLPPPPPPPPPPVLVPPAPRQVELGDLTSLPLQPIPVGGDHAIATGRFSLFPSSASEPVNSAAGAPAEPDVPAAPQGASADDADVPGESAVQAGVETDTYATPVIGEAREDELVAAFSPPPAAVAVATQGPPKRRMRLRSVRS